MKAIIVEDEILAARNLQTILAELGTVQVVAVLDSVAETLEWFEVNPQPELMFLDIHLADGSAFEIFDRVQVHCPIIFTTAYDEYALKAFKVNSIDYLLKPIESVAVHKNINDIANVFDLLFCDHRTASVKEGIFHRKCCYWKIVSSICRIHQMTICWL